MTERREFDVKARVAIIFRACGSGRVPHCEKCGAWCPKRKDYHIDHVIPEGMRPIADQARKLVAADGQLLCLDCHDAKTDKDKAEIGLAKRREAYHRGVEKPHKQKFRRWPPQVRERERKPVSGVPRLMREGFVPAKEDQ